MSRVFHAMCPLLVSVFLSIPASTIGVAAPTISLQPISANVAHVITGTEIRIPSGGAGVEVTCEILFAGWGEVTLNGLLWGSARLAPAGYLGANAVPPNPGVNLNPKGYAPPDPDGGNRLEGFFVRFKICSQSGLDCQSAPGVCGGGDDQCIQNPRFFLAAEGNPIVGAGVGSLAYEVGASPQIQFTYTPDVEPYRYAATLIVEIPEGAAGTYSVGFDPQGSVMSEGNLIDLFPELVPAKFTIAGQDGAPPLAAPPPHDRAKNRYLSFVPNSGTDSVAFQVIKVAGPGASGPVGWVGVPDANSLAGLSPSPAAPRMWTEPVVHVGDCGIIPDAVYEVYALTENEHFSTPLRLDTVPRPDPKHWGDTVGGFDDEGFGPPNGIVNVNDFLAAVRAFQQSPLSPHVSVVDIQSVSASDPCLNRITNIADVLLLIKAFQGESYPFTTDPGKCPPCQ